MCPSAPVFVSGNTPAICYKACSHCHWAPSRPTDRAHPPALLALHVPIPLLSASGLRPKRHKRGRRSMKCALPGDRPDKYPLSAVRLVNTKLLHQPGATIPPLQHLGSRPRGAVPGSKNEGPTKAFGLGNIVSGLNELPELGVGYCCPTHEKRLKAHLSKRALPIIGNTGMGCADQSHTAGDVNCIRALRLTQFYA